MPGVAARCVFACFKRVERWGDAITGFAGPWFIGLAVCLLVGGTICFLDVVMPTLPWPVLTVPPCLLIIANLFAHYYYVCTVSPGFVDEEPIQLDGHSSLLWAKRRADGGRHGGVSWSDELGLNITPASMAMCRKCNRTRPERAHHCRVCKRCVLKFDHHCPVMRELFNFFVFLRINQCVGINNERHFVLFMAYLVIATASYVLTGIPHVYDAFGLNDPFKDTWTHNVPAVYFAVTYVLCFVMCFAVSVMLAWHLYSVAQAETAVEGHDHDAYRAMARERGDVFVNSYDLGWKTNLQLFFNLGPGRYPVYSLLLPLRVPPYTDGRAWARRAGLERHAGVRVGEELTDEED